MAKKVLQVIKLQIPAGQASPAPPVGPALGGASINIMEFCKAFNAQTQAGNGTITPVEVTVYEDRSFTFITKTPPAAVLIRQALGIDKGSPEPHKEKVANLSRAQLRQIAETKLPDLNANSVESAMTIIAGTARSMGVTVDARVRERAWAKRGKRYQQAKSEIDTERVYHPLHAVRIIKEQELTRFDPTVEVHLRLGVNVRHADQQLRGTISLPHGTGRGSPSPSSPRATRRARPRPPARTSWAATTWPSGCRRASTTSTSPSPRRT